MIEPRLRVARRSAREAGLAYVSDAAPGIRRKRRGKSFGYVGPDGKAVRDSATLERISSLAIPPAWEDVWICADPAGHLQAVGRDARGRKQYRYHADWSAVRDAAKYKRLAAFGTALPLIREIRDDHLKLPGMPKRKVLAAAVWMLENTRIRVGNEVYSKENESFGLTTLRTHHVHLMESVARFRFRGKSGKEHDVWLDDPRLVRIVEECLELPGQELFQYTGEDGATHPITSEDVNHYIRILSNGDFTAKDFRTWAGTLMAARYCGALQPKSESEAKQMFTRAVRLVAAELRNTPAVCRQCYIHPVIFEAFKDGTLPPALRRQEPHDTSDPALAPDEKALLKLLRSRRARKDS